MRTRLLVSLTVLAAAMLPASAHAAGFNGVVIAKEVQRGTLVVAGPSGAGLTVRGKLSLARLGDRVLVGGVRLGDGTLRAASLRVVGHAKRATVRGVVVRQLARRTLLSTGGSVIAIQRRAPRRVLASALDNGLAAGDVAQIGVSIHASSLSETSTTTVGTTGTVRIEGRIVSVSPLVVNVEGLPITVGVPAGTAVPAGLAPDVEVELTVTVATGNVFTLVSVDDVSASGDHQGGSGSSNDQSGDQQGTGTQGGEHGDQGQEVEVEGAVVSSSAAQLVVQGASGPVTFVVPAGLVLPVLSSTSVVDAKGVLVNGVLTLEKLEVKGAEHASGSGGGSGEGSGSGSSGDGGSGGGDG